MDNEGWFKLLEERIESLRLQLGRLVSHFDSEQRTSIRHGRDIDKNISRMDTLEKRMDSLEKLIEKKNENWKYWIPVAISIIALLISWFK